MQAALRDGRASDERWHLRQGEERFWASGEMMPLRDEDGAHIGFMKILRDRTAGMWQDERLRRPSSGCGGRWRPAGSVYSLLISINIDCCQAPEFLPSLTDCLCRTAIPRRRSSPSSCRTTLTWSRRRQAAPAAITFRTSCIVSAAPILASCDESTGPVKSNVMPPAVRPVSSVPPEMSPPSTRLSARWPRAKSGSKRSCSQSRRPLPSSRLSSTTMIGPSTIVSSRRTPHSSGRRG